MITEQQWLQITQSFPSKPEVEELLVPSACEPPPKSAKRTAAVSASMQDEKMGAEDRPDARMKEFLRQRVGKGKQTTKPNHTHALSQDDASLTAMMEVMESKLKSLASQLLEKNRKIDEQEMKLRELERKLELREISESIEVESQEVGGEEAKGRKFQLEKRLVRLEAQMELVLEKCTKGCYEESQSDKASAAVVPKGRNQIQAIKARGNLASNYRLNFHGVNGRPSPEDRIDREYFEEKISSLEKLVESLKQFMFFIISQRGLKK